MFYSMVPILAFVVVLVLNYEILFSRKYQPTNPKALKTYRIFIYALLFFFIISALRGFFDQLEYKTPAVVIMNFFYLAMAVLLLTWTNFVSNFISEMKFFKIIIRIAGWIFAILGATFVLINIFYPNPFLFSYENSIFTPKMGNYLFLGLQTTTFGLIAIYSIVATARSKGYKKGQFFSLVAFSLVMMGCVTAQLYFPQYPVYSFGCCVGAIIVNTFIVVSYRALSRRAIMEGEDRERRQLQEIEDTRMLAYIDPLTGAKNKHAFVELEEDMDLIIHGANISDFALAIFDLNDLKLVNDTYGHEAGDQYIIKSCEMIRSYFPNTDVYRFGGDEFVIILQAELYNNRFKILEAFNAAIDKNVNTNEPVIAAGMSEYNRNKDNTLRAIFLRADERMYARKRRLKDATKRKESEDEVGNKSTGASLLSLRYEMYEMFYRSSGVSLIDMLNGSSCDEIVEVDLNNDSFKQFYHVDGKYFVPAVGFSYRDLIDFTFNYIIHPDDRETYLELMRIEGFFDRLKTARIPNFDFAHFRYKLQDGTYRWVEQVVIAGEEFGIPKGMFRLYVFDIHNIKSRQLGNIPNESSVVSLGKDQMTGLYTSKDFVTKSEEAVAKNSERNWCLVAIDIEHFKLFDEWFGREKGNYLLAKIGAIIRDYENENGAIGGYFGQDDFIVLCEYDKEKLKEIYDKLHTTINEFGLSTGFLPSFGVALIDKGMAIVDAFDRATIAAMKAKSDIKNRICVYNEEMQVAADQETRILTDFIHALQNDEITFFLQPQCLATNGKVIGAEALARWVKADGTVVSPGYFIPVLEKYSFVTDLDKCIWDKVFAWVKSWIDRGHKAIPVSINISRIDIFSIDIVEHFMELHKKYQVPPKLIEIEITESAYAENMNTAGKIVEQLRKIGFKVLVDDFGSGYSSLNMLSSLKIDVIKLDAKFLQFDDEYHQKGIRIIESVITMAKSMSLPMIVEGVETKQQIDFLDQFGVRYIQGYYFYKPLPIKEYEKIIIDEKNIDERGIVVRTNEQFRIREFLDKNIYSDSMLNNVIGAVAIYSLNKDHVDIVRFNQQFMEAVDVPNMVERLESIEETMPVEDRPLLFQALYGAKENKLLGYTAVLRFYKTDGVLTSFKMHFYYIGVKEGTDRFYGSATNVTDLVDLKEGNELIAKYSSDNMILVRHVGDFWKFTVLSHNLSDLLGIDPATLEEELNAGINNDRIYEKNELQSILKQVNETKPYKGLVLENIITIVNVRKQKIKIRVWIEYVGGETNNYAYILRTEKYEPKK